MKLKTVLIAIVLMIITFAVLHALISLIYAFYIGCIAGSIVLLIWLWWSIKKWWKKM